MKYLVLLALVLGFAHGNKEEESSLQKLPSLDNLLSSLDGVLPVEFIEFTRDANNILSNLKNNDSKGPMEKMRAVTKVIKIKDIVDKIVAPIAQIALELVELANYIVAIVGLVVLIIFLIDGGDFKSLLGTGRSLPTWSSSDFNPLLDTLSEIFFQAQQKYD